MLGSLLLPGLFLVAVTGLLGVAFYAMRLLARRLQQPATSLAGQLPLRLARWLLWLVMSLLGCLMLYVLVVGGYFLMSSAAEDAALKEAGLPPW